VDWLTDESNVMELCFIIGAIHLTLAHIWTAVTVFPRRSFLAQIGWVAIVWSMFFVARAVVLNRPFFGLTFYVLAGGVLLVIAFLMPPARMREHLMEYVLLPLTLVGFFVDVISYIRLFAVGVAGVAVAESFNGMAAAIGFEFPGAVFAAIILIFGHSLNLALALLAVLVHGVRLNTLEFSAHKGLTWSGFGFRPFGRESPADVSKAS
jgi:V/A-type H+-transporting ATPase subunit I